MLSIPANKKATMAGRQSTLGPEAMPAAWQTGLQTQNQTAMSLPLSHTYHGTPKSKHYELLLLWAKHHGQREGTDLEQAGKVVAQAGGAEVVTTGLQGHAAAQRAQADLALEVLQGGGLSCGVGGGQAALQA